MGLVRVRDHDRSENPWHCGRDAPNVQENACISRFVTGVHG